MKVILTRSKPLSERISAFLSAICHAVVGGLWKNTKGHNVCRHNSARGEKYIMKKGMEGGKNERRRKGNRCGGERCKCKICWFCLKQPDKETQREKGRKRKSSGKNAQRNQHNVKLSSWLIPCSVTSHVVVGGLTPVSSWTLARFLCLWAFPGLANFSWAPAGWLCGVIDLTHYRLECFHSQPSIGVNPPEESLSAHALDDTPNYSTHHTHHTTHKHRPTEHHMTDWLIYFHFRG